MTVLASAASQEWTPQTQTIPFVLTGTPERIRITLNRSGWPAGLCAKAECAWNVGGSKATAWLYGEGAAGLLVSEYGIPAGATGGTVRVEVIQATTTSILVESI